MMPKMKCLRCKGKGMLLVELQRGGREVWRHCRECAGTGERDYLGITTRYPDGIEKLSHD